MATFLNDTFTEASSDVEVDAHTGETGATWTKHTTWGNSTGIIKVVAAIDRVRHWFSGGNPAAVYYASGTPASADYTVTGQMYYAGNAAAPGNLAIMGRVDTSAVKTAYVAYWNEGVAWTLDKWVSGTQTNLGTYAATTLTGTQTYALKLEMVGTAIKVYIDSVERISVTDGAITAAGRAGIGKIDAETNDGSDSYGIHIDSIVGADAVAGPFALDDSDGFMLTTIQMPLTAVRLY